MKRMITLTLAIVALMLARHAQGAGYCLSKNWRGEWEMQSVTHDPAQCQGSAAYGYYNRSMNKTGWNELYVVTNQTWPDDYQAYAAGFFEGAASYQEILWWHHNNYGPGTVAGKMVNDDLSNFLMEHVEWMANTSKEQRNSGDPKWLQAGYLLMQTEGMLDGINYAAQQRGDLNMTKVKLWYMLALTDITNDLSVKFPSNKSQTPQQVADLRDATQNIHCSGLITLSPNLDNIFFGHTTWMRYNTMLRIYKTFTLNFNDVPMPGRTIQFSSYPATLASTDDFYVTSGGFVVIETSFYNWNASLYKYTTPHTILASMRTMLASRMATSGREWSELFGWHNSGTYNNQWMVLNLNLFEPGHSLKPDLLWIVEQLPGTITAMDRTYILSYGYWPSYNVPSYRNVYDTLGYPPHAITNPMYFSYENCARAQLYRELARNVSTIDDMKYVMRYNDFMQNPIEKQNPWYAVAARGELCLQESQRDASGGLDSKISDYYHVMRRTGALDGVARSIASAQTQYNPEVFAISGPTMQGQPTMSWTEVESKVPTSKIGPHVGLPQVYNFSWQLYRS